MQPVWNKIPTALVVKGATLPNTKAMLLVDDSEPEVIKENVGLYQCMSADHQLHRSISGSCKKLSPTPMGRRSGQQPHLHQAAGESIDRLKVLVGKCLGRRHEGRLPSRFDRTQHRMQCDDRLARAHLSHQECLHGAFRFEIFVKISDRPLLVGSQIKRKRYKPALYQLIATPQIHCPRLPLPVSFSCRNCKLLNEKLLKRKPVPRSLCLLS